MPLRGTFAVISPPIEQGYTTYKIRAQRDPRLALEAAFMDAPGSHPADRAAICRSSLPLPVEPGSHGRGRTEGGLDRWH